MGTGTSRELFLQQCRGAWVHGSIVTDGFDPSAVCESSHEALPPIRNGAVMVDHAGLPGLLGGAERARFKELRSRNSVRKYDDETMIRRDDDHECHDTNAPTYNNTHNHTRPYTNRSREIDIASDRSMYVTIAHAVMIENARNSIEQHDTNTNTNTNTRMPRPYCA